GAFATALAQVQGDHGGQWTLHVQDEALVASLQGLGLRTTSETPVYYAFIGF
ncbi:YkgJ family cysteine cluster protein, partial [Pseudomonas sp. SIMBA_065]